MAGRTRTGKHRQTGRTCGALNRRGLPCQCKLLYLKKNGKWRCKFHGGLSTGPKTEAGKIRAAEALRRWRAARKFT